jgi:hypothetical protein
MELNSFGLLWLSEPTETCFHDGADLKVQESPLDIRGPWAERFIVELARCPACGQWYGPLPLLYDIMDDFGWDASDIEGFALKNDPVTSGVDLNEATIPWDTFGQQIRRMEEAGGAPPSDEEVQALGPTPTTWEIAQAPAT